MNFMEWGWLFFACAIWVAVISMVNEQQPTGVLSSEITAMSDNAHCDLVSISRATLGRWAAMAAELEREKGEDK